LNILLSWKMGKNTKSQSTMQLDVIHSVQIKFAAVHLCLSKLWSRSAGITAVIRGMVPSYCYIILYKFTLWFGDILVYTDHHLYIKHIHAIAINKVLHQTHTVCAWQTSDYCIQKCNFIFLYGCHFVSNSGIWYC